MKRGKFLLIAAAVILVVAIFGIVYFLLGKNLQLAPGEDIIVGSEVDSSSNAVLYTGETEPYLGEGYDYESIGAGIRGIVQAQFTDAANEKWHKVLWNDGSVRINPSWVKDSDVTLVVIVFCGNGAIDSGEECDGGNFGAGGSDCSAYGYESGIVGCTNQCVRDYSNCADAAGSGGGETIIHDSATCFDNDGTLDLLGQSEVKSNITLCDFYTPNSYNSCYSAYDYCNSSTILKELSCVNASYSGDSIAGSVLVKRDYVNCLGACRNSACFELTPEFSVGDIVETLKDTNFIYDKPYPADSRTYKETMPGNIGNITKIHLDYNTSKVWYFIKWKVVYTNHGVYPHNINPAWFDGELMLASNPEDFEEPNNNVSIQVNQTQNVTNNTINNNSDGNNNQPGSYYSNPNTNSNGGIGNMDSDLPEENESDIDTMSNLDNLNETSSDEGSKDVGHRKKLWIWLIVLILFIAIVAMMIRRYFNTLQETQVS